MTVAIVGGSWGDVAPDLTVSLAPEGGAWLLDDRLADTTDRWTFDSTNPIDPRCARNGALRCVAYKDGQEFDRDGHRRPGHDHVRASMDGVTWHDLGLGATVMAVDVTPFAGGFRLFVVSSPWAYRVWFLAPGLDPVVAAAVPIPLPDGTSQGIVDVDGNGLPVWTDATWAGPVLFPTRAPGVLVGQRRGDAWPSAPDALIALVDSALYVVFGELAREPRIAQDHDGTYRLTARLIGNRRLDIRGADLPLGLLQVPPTPPPVPPPAPPPAPTPPKEPRVRAYPSPETLVTEPFAKVLRAWGAKQGATVPIEAATTAAFVIARGGIRVMQDYHGNTTRDTDAQALTKAVTKHVADAEAELGVGASPDPQ